MRNRFFAVLLLVCLLVALSAATACGELNAFMGVESNGQEAPVYQPRSNTAIGDTVDSSDSLIYYFYRPNCKYCSERADMVLAGLPEEIILPDGRSSKIKLVVLNKSDPEEARMIQAYYEREEIQAERQLVPAILIGDRYLCGSNEIKFEFLCLLLRGDGLQTPYIDGKRRDEP